MKAGTQATRWADTDSGWRLVTDTRRATVAIPEHTAEHCAAGLCYARPVATFDAPNGFGGTSEIRYCKYHADDIARRRGWTEVQS